jgi:predicted peroxiredoxin
MADKLLIVLANVELTNADQLLPPLSQAAIAAAMEYEVEVIFTGQAGRLAIKNVAQTIYTSNHEPRSAMQLILDAKAAGVVFKVCTPALDLWGHDLIAEITETVGGAYVITESMDDSVVTFTY